jgi:hypothetical protein
MNFSFREYKYKICKRVHDMKLVSSLSVSSVALILLFGLVSFSFVPVAHANGSGVFTCITGDLFGANETPPNFDLPAHGTIDVTVDTISNTVLFTLSFDALSSGATAAHIHQAPAGVAGPVKVPLPLGAAAGQTSATTSGTGVPIVGFNVADIVNNPTGFYVNLHSTLFPGGEIRGQIISCISHAAVPEFNSALGALVLVALFLPIIAALKKRSLISPL